MTHTTISRRQAIATLGAAGVLGLTGTPGVFAQGTAARPATVRLGYQKSSTLIAVLKAQGVLEKQLAPLNATLSWHEFTSGLPLLEALNLDNLDISAHGESAYSTPKDGAWTEARIIALVRREAVRSGLVARPDATTA
jgi:sulfonate transport system substrate-binding protein